MQTYYNVVRKDFNFYLSNNQCIKHDLQTFYNVVRKEFNCRIKCDLQTFYNGLCRRIITWCEKIYNKVRKDFNFQCENFLIFCIFVKNLSMKYEERKSEYSME